MRSGVQRSVDPVNGTEPAATSLGGPGRLGRPRGSEGASAAISALSRVFAVLGIMVLLGLLGAVIDRWLGTQFAMLIGIVLGTMIAVIGMIYAVKVVEIEQRQSKIRRDGEQSREAMREPRHEQAADRNAPLEGDGSESQVVELAGGGGDGMKRALEGENASEPDAKWRP